nr:translation initiation factor IF-2-like [Pan troglodytes]XP_054535924.1 translation initiation factor IF-2-like [Pan troglodytes]
MGSNTARGRVLRKAEVRRPSSHAQRVLGSGLHPTLIWGPRGSPPDSAPVTRCLAGSAARGAPARAARPGPLRPAPRASRRQLLHGTGPNSPEPHLAAPRPRSREDFPGAANARSLARPLAPAAAAGRALGRGGEPRGASRGRLDSRAPAEPQPRDAGTTRERGGPRPLPPRPPRAPA